MYLFKPALAYHDCAPCCAGQAPPAPQRPDEEEARHLRGGRARALQIIPPSD